MSLEAQDRRGIVILRIAVTMIAATLAYSVGVIAHRALEYEVGAPKADRKMGEVRSGPRTSWAAKKRTVLVRDAPDPPPDDQLVASMKSELADVLNRAAALVPEEDALWMVSQVYALNRAHAGPSARARTSP